MEEEEFYNKIKKALEEIPDSFSILEEKINIETQTWYFNYSNRLKEKGHLGKYLKMSDILFSDVEIEKKREILCGLASVADVKAYRIIEKYVKNPDTLLNDWAILALQESRMLLQSSILDEQQVYISTGLGGKGSNLRYNVIFTFKDSAKILELYQEKVLKNELEDLLRSQNGELEDITFFRGYTATHLNLPLKAPLKEIFKNLVATVNDFGSFLSDDVIVTNVKTLSEKEIKRIIASRKDSLDLE
ncbi:MAG: hypothetical protein JXR31_04300 [Prolixibacteraceae bacterium]|nr:hypothetical protein [Prolixibacteraceae bacterium]MBN2773445.1 hypothetical protein [Prolixibacteraceae bacterium]